MDHFQFSDKFKNKILNPFWTPPPGARMPKRGADPDVDGIWDEPVVIEDFQFNKMDNGDEVIYMRVRVEASTETENAGASHRERFSFPSAGIGDKAQDNLAVVVQINYRNLIACYRAAGYEGSPSPGEIDPDDMIGAHVTATVSVAPDKNGVRRMNLIGYRPMED